MPVETINVVINESASDDIESHNSDAKVLNWKAPVTNRNEVSTRVQEKPRKSNNISVDGCMHCNNSDKEASMFLGNQQSKE